MDDIRICTLIAPNPTPARQHIVDRNAPWVPMEAALCDVLGVQALYMTEAERLNARALTEWRYLYVANNPRRPGHPVFALSPEGLAAMLVTITRP